MPSKEELKARIAMLAEESNQFRSMWKESEMNRSVAESNLFIQEQAVKEITDTLEEVKAQSVLDSIHVAAVRSLSGAAAFFNPADPQEVPTLAETLIALAEVSNWVTSLITELQLFLPEKEILIEETEPPLKETVDVDLGPGLT